jgi:fatty-acyl-CoA synthase
MSWLARSRLVASLDLGERGVLLAHILGRARVLCSRQACRLLSEFDVPLQWPATSAGPGTAADVHAAVSQLQKARLLLPAGAREAERIRKAYARAATVADVGRDTGGFVRPSRRGPNAGDLNDILDRTLVLPASVASLPVAEGETIAIHPTGSLTHMTDDLWAIARLFAGAARGVREAMNTFDRRGELDEPHFLLAVDFLCRRRLLWRHGDGERLAGLAYAEQFRGQPGEVGILYPWKDRWLQAFRAFHPACFKPGTARAAVAFIGPCLVQQSIACIEHTAETRGVRLECCGFPYPGRDLAHRHWDLVLAAATPYATAFISALSCEDFAAAEAEIPAVVAELDRLLDEIRTHTRAPVALVLPSRSGLGGSSPMATARHREIALVGRLTGALDVLARAHRDLILIDEDDLALRFGDTYWDDEFNGSVHHAPLSTFNWADLSVGRPANETGHAVRDPAGAMAMAVLDLVHLLAAQDHIRAVLIEPDWLLWHGSLAEHTKPMKAPSAFAGVQDNLIVGLHEALAKLSRRGLAIYMLFDGTRELLEARYQVGTEAPNAVAVSDLRRVFFDTAPADAARLISEELGIGEEQVLLLDTAGKHDVSAFAGYVFDGLPHRLRRALLTDPKLRSRQELERQSVRPAPADRPAPRPQPSPSMREIRQVILQVVSRETKRSIAECEQADDFRSLGLDSLGVMLIAVALEEKLGLRLSDTAVTEFAMFKLPVLEREIARQLNRRGGRPAAKPAAVAARAGDAGSADTAERLRRTLEGARHAWSVKALYGAEHGEWRYITGRELLREGERLAARLREAGLVRGERVLICAASEAEQLTALVSSMLAGLSFMIFSPFRGETPTARAARIRQICEDHRVSAVAISATDQATGGLLAQAVAGGAEAMALGPDLLLHVASDQFRPEAGNRETEPRLMLLTSGSTGGRRLITHPLSVIDYHARALEDALDLDSRDIMVSWTPLHHAMGLGNGLLLPLLWGTRLIRIPSELWTAHPAILFRELSEERATLSYMPNFAFSYCASHVSSGLMAGMDLSHVRALVSSGEPVGPAIAAGFLEKFAQHGLRATAMLAAYGMSETAGCIAQARPGRTPLRLYAERAAFETLGRFVAAAPGKEAIPLMSSGAVLAGTGVLVDGARTPEELGELLVEAPTLTAATGIARDRFVEIDGRTYLRTGDLGLVMSGEVFVVGRADDMIKCSGQLVDPADVEAVVKARFPEEVVEAVAVGMPASERGTERLVLLVEAARFEERSQDALAAKLAQAVWSAIGLVVERVVVLAPGALVRTVTGKKSRKLSKEKLLAEREAVT